jgi:hypothetical protein
LTAYDFALLGAWGRVGNGAWGARTGALDVFEPEAQQTLAMKS